MDTNIKLENKLKTLNEKEGNELIPIKITVEQAKKMLREGNGETAYNKIFDMILKTKEQLQESVDGQFKKTEIQRFKSQLEKYMSNIVATIDDIERYTYHYVDNAMEVQEAKMDSIEVQLVDLIITKDELEKIKEINENILKEHSALEIDFKELNLKCEGLEGTYVTLEEELTRKIGELDEVNKQLTTATSRINDLLIEHKEEVSVLTERINKEQEIRIECEKNIYEKKLKEEGLLNNIKEEKERVKELKDQIEEERIVNKQQLEEIRKEKDEKIEGLFKENNKLEFEVKNKENEITKLEEKKKELEELNRAKDKLEVELAEIKSRHSKVEKDSGNQLKELKTERNRYQQSQDELKIELKKMKEENERLRLKENELSDLKIKNEILEKQAEIANEKLIVEYQQLANKK